VYNEHDYGGGGGGGGYNDGYDSYFGHVSDRPQSEQQLRDPPQANNDHSHSHSHNHRDERDRSGGGYDADQYGATVAGQNDGGGGGNGWEDGGGAIPPQDFDEAPVGGGGGGGTGGGGTGDGGGGAGSFDGMEHPEYGASVAKVPCQICGRMFNGDRLAVHTRICKKAASKPKKVYDAVGEPSYYFELPLSPSVDVVGGGGGGALLKLDKPS
jgi:hypothetical protein